MRAAGVLSFERCYAVQRLDEVGVDPGSLAASIGKPELAVSSVGRVFGSGWLGLVKKDFEMLHLRCS